MAVMSQAKAEYSNRSFGVSADSNSLRANLRAVDERPRMACATQYMVPTAASSIDDVTF